VTVDGKVAAVFSWSEERRRRTLGLCLAERRRQRDGYKPERTAEFQNLGFEILLDTPCEGLEPGGNDEQHWLMVETARGFEELPKQGSEQLPVW